MKWDFRLLKKIQPGFNNPEQRYSEKWKTALREAEDAKMGARTWTSGQA
ncbi:hypothetical protein N752_07030 [Desulforamulus aquiferis]|nr:hypothetical protein N752_07030 [Desulforamulus aquiferis]